MTIAEAAKRAKRQKCCVMVARTDQDMAKPAYLMRGYPYEIGPGGHLRPYHFSLDDLCRDDWYVADDV